MKTIILNIILFTNLVAFSQIEMVDDAMYNTNSRNNKIDIHFSIYKIKKKGIGFKTKRLWLHREYDILNIYNYQAYIVDNRQNDTTYLYHDSIITLTKPEDSLKLVITYADKKYILNNAQKYIYGVATNIWFLLPEKIIEDDYTFQYFNNHKFIERSETKPTLYIQPLKGVCSLRALPESTDAKQQNNLKGKYLMPHFLNTEVFNRCPPWWTGGLIWFELGTFRNKKRK